MTDFQDIKDLVISKKIALEKRIRTLHRGPKFRDGSTAQDLEEQSIVLQTEEINDTLGDRDLEELRQIEAALRNLEFGKYGICKKCGYQIPFKRLKAMPYTQLCLDCAS